tara:strand:+ start:1961 stop:2167 length:207 start_codon:yes stop_codon:yes gene_type:complete
MPVAVHGKLPQMQGAALLGADPSVFVQAGAVRVHTHLAYELQEPPPGFRQSTYGLYLSVLTFNQHPRG